MSKHILVAPTIDQCIRHQLHFLSADGPVDRSSQEDKLQKGQTLYDYKAEDLGFYRGTGFLHNIKTTFSRAANVDISIKAPVPGYYRTSLDMFGRMGNKLYSSAQANENNRVATTIGELKSGENKLGQRVRSAFFALVDEPKELLGSDLYSGFFDKLLGNTDLISAWLMADPSYREWLNEFSDQNDLSYFWDAVKSERDRLASIRCPILPDDSDLFLNVTR